MPAIFTIFIANLAFGFIRNKKQNMRYQAHNGTNNGYGILKYPAWIDIFIIIVNCVFLCALFDSIVVSPYDKTSELNIFEGEHDGYSFTDVVFFSTMEICGQLLLLFLLNYKVYFSDKELINLLPFSCKSYPYKDIESWKIHGEFVRLFMKNGKKIMIGPRHWVDFTELIHQIQKHKYGK